MKFKRCKDIFFDLQAILSTTKHNEKSILYSHLSTWLREGLLLSKGKVSKILKYYNKLKAPQQIT